MAALSAERLSQPIETWDRRRMPAAGGEKFYKGGMACVDTADGYFHKGATSTTLRFVGTFAETVDNTSGADGAVTVDIEFAHPILIKWWNNDAGGGALAQANVGSVCYILNDQTVTATSTGASKAGIVWAIETIDGVSQVAVEPVYPAIAG